jgi:hypothetical protein
VRPWYLQGVPARVAVIVLGAVLLVFTGYLVVQVSAGPRADAVANVAPPPASAAYAHEEVDEPSPAAEVAPKAPPEVATAEVPTPVDPLAPISLSSFGTGATGAANTYQAPAAVSAAANLQFDEANKLYDRREYEEARALALSLLQENPTSVRMRRIVVASSCIMGDQDVAQQHYSMLPERDRGDMRIRCVPYGSTFRE